MMASTPGEHDDPYNYSVFRGDAEDWEGFMGHPHVGERAPDGILTTLDGTIVHLADLWRDAHLLLEFGSYT